MKIFIFVGFLHVSKVQDFGNFELSPMYMLYGKKLQVYVYVYMCGKKLYTIICVYVWEETIQVYYTCIVSSHTYIHILCGPVHKISESITSQAAKEQASLRICADLPESSLLTARDWRRRRSILQCLVSTAPCMPHLCKQASKQT